MKPRVQRALSMTQGRQRPLSWRTCRFGNDCSPHVLFCVLPDRIGKRRALFSLLPLHEQVLCSRTATYCPASPEPQISYRDEADDGQRLSVMAVHATHAFSSLLDCEHRLEDVELPKVLQSLTFGQFFNQSLNNAALPGGLQSLTFGYHFNQSLDNVTLPGILLSLSFAHDFTQKLA